MEFKLQGCEISLNGAFANISGNLIIVKRLQF